MLAAFTDELDKIAPRFDIEGSQIKILGTPAEFYETLKVNWIRSLGRFEADVQ
jgi:CDP-diacylglycerol--glycerol-3-phosphate 3-phosphatidyltransferase